LLGKNSVLKYDLDIFHASGGYEEAGETVLKWYLGGQIMEKDMG
jgi:hypothetical protein